MLGKLIKYEFRATGRLMGPVYLAVVVLAILMRISTSMNSMAGGFQNFTPLAITAIRAIIVVLYVVALAAVMIITFVLIIQRFYKNLLQSEGYLMHTLPVPTWQHIVSKAVVAIVWSIASICVAIFSMVILSVYNLSLTEFGRFFSYAVQLLTEKYDASMLLSIFLICLVLLLYSVSVIMKFYASMATGQLASKHKVLASFGAYIGFYIIQEIIDGAIVGIMGVSSVTAIFDLIHNTFVSLLALSLLLIIRIAIYFTITEILMRKKLNLE